MAHTQHNVSTTAEKSATGELDIPAHACSPRSEHVLLDLSQECRPFAREAPTTLPANHRHAPRLHALMTCAPSPPSSDQPPSPAGSRQRVRAHATQLTPLAAPMHALQTGLVLRLRSRTVHLRPHERLGAAAALRKSTREPSRTLCTRGCCTSVLALHLEPLDGLVLGHAAGAVGAADGGGVATPVLVAAAIPT
eukprot:CAMPEP_0206250050 /NCGR_PEP_ID=MMETSP0047_2-20121206/21254_1 /ASSEMBLY_ACC=CAM_ASM_000192 /TAXON_ID=195065 /ORGANISM="Chroomonas mesostigmatica_cf, Strain CCMP1168" /LENGTH=193 /DNA_ID=CAMNT_0053675851 /DNA_START=664 /DNA_END=1243 /DNA_ORIENTATION=+